MTTVNMNGTKKTAPDINMIIEVISLANNSSFEVECEA